MTGPPDNFAMKQRLADWTAFAKGIGIGEMMPAGPYCPVLTGLTGCSWYKCPTYHKKEGIPARAMLLCSGCQKVSIWLVVGVLNLQLERQVQYCSLQCQRRCAIPPSPVLLLLTHCSRDWREGDHKVECQAAAEEDAALVPLPESDSEAAVEQPRMLLNPKRLLIMALPSPKAHSDDLQEDAALTAVNEPNSERPGTPQNSKRLLITASPSPGSHSEDLHGSQEEL